MKKGKQQSSEGKKMITRELIDTSDMPQVAIYAPIFKITGSDRDVFIDLAQPGVGDNDLVLVSRIAIPLKTAEELVSALEGVIKGALKK